MLTTLRVLFTITSLHWLSDLFNLVRRKTYLYRLLKQESIPAGCIPPALVPTTRCQHQAVYLLGSCTFQVPCLRGALPSTVIIYNFQGRGIHTQRLGHTHSPHTPTNPKFDQGPDIPTPRMDMDLRHTHQPLVDRQTLVKKLPSTVTGGNKAK